MALTPPADPYPISSADDALLAGCLAGERAAQYQLYQRYKTSLFSTALRIVGERELAQDALQEAFVNIFRQLATFRRQSTLGAWMRTIVVRQALMVLRVENRMEAYDSTRHPEPQVDWQDSLTGEALEKAIGELPPGYRSVFCLIEVEGYAHREVAELLGISEGTSKSQLYRAKRMLQTKLFHLYQ